MVVACVALAAVLAAAPNHASEKLSRWEMMDANGQRTTLIVAGAMLFVLAFLVWRQLRKRKAPPHDPVKLHRWFRDYQYDWATGTAVNVTYTEHHQGRWLAIEGGSGDGYALDRGRVGLVTTIFEEVTIVFEGGQHDINVSFSEDGRGGSAFPVFRGREGHRITAIWRRRSKGEERGKYVVFRDWTTGRNLDHPAASPYIHQSDAPIFSFGPVLVLGWIVGQSAYWLPFFDGLSRNFLLAIVAGAIWFAIQFIVGTMDRHRSDDQLAQALLVIGANDAAPQDPRAAP